MLKMIQRFAVAGVVVAVGMLIISKALGVVVPCAWSKVIMACVGVIIVVRGLAMFVAVPEGRR